MCSAAQRKVVRAVARVGQMLLVALAAALGAPAPKLLRHEDAIVHVAQDKEAP